MSDLFDLYDSGETNVKIHTAVNFDGEIRGTIQQG